MFYVLIFDPGPPEFPIFPSPRWRPTYIHSGNLKKYVGNMKQYEGNNYEEDLFPFLLARI